MSGEPITMPHGIPRDLADLADDDVVELQNSYRPGVIGKQIALLMMDAVNHYADGRQKTKILEFLKWVKPDILEQFLVLSLEYGAQKTSPQAKKGRGRG